MPPFGISNGTRLCCRSLRSFSTKVLEMDTEFIDLEKETKPRIETFENAQDEDNKTEDASP